MNVNRRFWCIECYPPKQNKPIHCCHTLSLVSATACVLFAFHQSQQLSSYCFPEYIRLFSEYTKALLFLSPKRVNVYIAPSTKYCTWDYDRIVFPGDNGPDPCWLKPSTSGEVLSGERSRVTHWRCTCSNLKHSPQSKALGQGSSHSFLHLTNTFMFIPCAFTIVHGGNGAIK
jgi:hypothetical protein